MRSNDYLYGEGVVVLPVPPEVANKRIELLRANLRRLMDVHFSERDVQRINAVCKAIEYWEKMK